MNVSADLDHLGTDRDDAGKRLGAVLRLQAPIFGLEPIEIERPPNDQVQGLDIDRFVIEVIGAEADGPHRVLALGLTAHDDDFGLGCERQDGFQRRQSLRGTILVRWQAKIEQDDRRRLLFKHSHGSLPAAGQADVETVEGPAQLPLQGHVVIDDQKFVFRFVHQTNPSRPGICLRRPEICLRRPAARRPAGSRGRWYQTRDY